MVSGKEKLHWTFEEWQRVVWTDESTFSTTAFGRRRQKLMGKNIEIVFWTLY